MSSSKFLGNIATTGNGGAVYASGIPDVNSSVTIN